MNFETSIRCSRTSGGTLMKFGSENNMTSRKILISICSLADFKKSVRRSFKHDVAGDPAQEPVHRVFFTSEEDLFSTLSPKRMELLKFLKKHGPLSCRKLASELNRAYA